MARLYLSELFLNTLKGHKDIKSIMLALQVCDEELYSRIGYIKDREALASKFFGSSNFSNMKPGKMYQELSDFFNIFKKYKHIIDRHRVGERFYDMYIFHIITDVSCIYEEWRYEALKSKVPKRVLINHQELMESVQQIPNKTNIKFMTSEKDGIKMTADFPLEDSNDYTKAAVRRLFLEWISSVGVAAVLATDIEQEDCNVYGIWFNEGKWMNCSEWAISPIVDRILEGEDINRVNKVRFRKIVQC